MNYAYQCSKYYSHENKTNDNNSCCWVNSFSLRLVNLRVMHIFSKFPRIQPIFLSIKFKLGSNRAYLIRRANFTVSRFLPNSSSWTWNTLNSMATNQTLGTWIAFRSKVVFFVLHEELVWQTIFTLPILKNRSYWARNTLTSHELFCICAFCFWNSHHHLTLLIISVSSSNHHWVLHVFEEMKWKSMPPR